MKPIFSLILFTALSLAILPAFAQQKKVATQPTDTTKYKIFEYADTSPEFPGGDEALMKFLFSQVQNVDMANKPEGLAVLNFVVTETGEIKDITVLKSL